MNKIFEEGQYWISSLELIKETNKKHFSILRDIRMESNRINNKKQKSNFICKKSFYIDKNNEKRTMYLLNEEFYNFMLDKYTLNSKLRYGEDLIKEMLEGTFLNNVKYQYRILNYRVDFYIPYLSLIIEYDEEFHQRQNEQDEKRMKEILIELKKQIVEDSPWMDKFKPEEITKVIRIKQGEEFTVVNKVLQFCDHIDGLDILIHKDDFED